jgi:manganese transport protein
MSLLSSLKSRASEFDKEVRPPSLTAIELFRFIVPGLLVTVGFIDPGNWVANISGGAQFGSILL